MIVAPTTTSTFKGIQKYPYNYTKKQNEAFDYVRDNILMSPKYADKKGNTLLDSFDKLGLDVVAYPTKGDHITFEINHKNKPLESIEEVNRTYPNVYRTSCTSDEQLADIFKTKLDTCQRTIKSVKNNIAWIVGGMATMLIGGLALLYAASHNPKIQQEAVEKTIMQKDAIKTATKDTIELFKN